jgi:hypothetical protein
MKRYYNETFLEMVEMYAEEVGNISSEDELSEIFDNEIVESVINKYGKNDQCAIDEAFNNWTDSLYKNREIHEEQYNNYNYVGKYS